MTHNWRICFLLQPYIDYIEYIYIYIPLKLFLVHVICLQNFSKLNLQARNFFQNIITSCCSTEFRECVLKFFFFLNVKSIECISFSFDNHVAKSRKQITATWLHTSFTFSSSCCKDSCTHNFARSSTCRSESTAFCFWRLSSCKIQRQFKVFWRHRSNQKNNYITEIQKKMDAWHYKY